MTEERSEQMEINSLQEAENLVRSIGIPPQPEILMELNKMARSADADLQLMGQLVARDVGLAARVVRLASSPLFGSGQPVTSIQEALMALGMDVFRKSVLTAAIEAAFSADNRDNREFWRHSQITARLCQVLAERFCPELSDESYSLGLFHDLAVVIMLKKHPEYWRIRSRALLWDESITQDEDEQLMTNHASVGFFVGRRWHLAPEILEAILFHHEPDLTLHDNLRTRRLIALLQLSEILYTRDKAGDPPLNYQTYDDPDHIEMIAAALHFDPDNDLYDIVESAEAIFAEF